MLNFTRTAAVELAEFGIRVNAIAPGPVLWPEGGLEPDLQDEIVAKTALKRTGSPHGRTKYPYATAKIRQTTRYVTLRNEERAVWQSVCADGKCDASEMQQLMAIAPKFETVEFEALFKHEGGEWKLVANVSEPVEPGQPSKYAHVRRSVF